MSQVYGQRIAGDPADLPLAFNGIANRRLLAHDPVVFNNVRFTDREVVDKDSSGRP